MKRFSFTGNSEKLRITVNIEVRNIFQLKSTSSRTYTPLSTLSDLCLTLKKGKRISTQDLEFKEPEFTGEGNSFDRYPVHKNLTISCTLHRDLSTGLITDKKKAKLKLRSKRRGSIYGTSQKVLGVYKMHLEDMANEVGFEKIKVQEEAISPKGFSGYFDVKIITRLETIDDSTCNASSDGSDNSDNSDTSGTLSSRSFSPPDVKFPSLKSVGFNAVEELSRDNDDYDESIPLVAEKNEILSQPQNSLNEAIRQEDVVAQKPTIAEKPSFLDEMKKKAAAREAKAAAAASASLSGPTPGPKLSFLEELAAKKPKKVSSPVTEPIPAPPPSSSALRSNDHKSKRVAFSAESAAPQIVNQPEKPSNVSTLAPVAAQAVTAAPTASASSCNDPYIQETVAILRRQLKEHGIIPLEYIPLDAIKKEMEKLIAACNTGAPYDEDRLDHLIRCMDYNPEHQREKEEAARQWRRDIQPLIDESVESMKGFVPPHIFTASVKSLAEVDGLSKELIKRLTTKQCLWLVRIPAADIEKIHEAELLSRFNPLAQNLDIIELAAIYGSLPAKFTSDSSGRKEKWRVSIEETLKAMNVQRLAGSLPPNKLRNPAYSKEDQHYLYRRTMHRMKAVKSEEAGIKRQSFLNIKGNRAKQLEAAATAALLEVDSAESEVSAPSRMKLNGATISAELNRLLGGGESSRRGSSNELVVAAAMAAAAATKAADAAASAAAAAADAVAKVAEKDRARRIKEQQNDDTKPAKPSFLEELANKSKKAASEDPPAKPGKPSFLEELAKKGRKGGSEEAGDAPVKSNKPSFLEELEKKSGKGSENGEVFAGAAQAPLKKLSFLEELALKKKKDEGSSLDTAESAPPVKKLSFLEELAIKRKKEDS